MTHGQPEEAERVVREIEARVERETGTPLPPVPHQALTLRTDVHSWFGAGVQRAADRRIAAGRCSARR